MPKVDKGLLPAFTPQDIEKLLKACVSARERALVFFLLDTGARVSETFPRPYITLHTLHFRPDSLLLQVRFVPSDPGSLLYRSLTSQGGHGHNRGVNSPPTVCYLTLIACWLLPCWLRVDRRGLTAVVPVLLAVAAVVWLGQTNLLVFVPVAMIAAVNLVGFPGATRVAAAASVALLAAVPWLTGALLILSLLALWLSTGLLYTLYGAMRQVSAWSWNNYRQRLARLEEARDRKAELDQVLDELAAAAPAVLTNPSCYLTG